jgi:hypothetical protein
MIDYISKSLKISQLHWTKPERAQATFRPDFSTHQQWHPNVKNRSAYV